MDNFTIIKNILRNRIDSKVEEITKGEAHLIAKGVAIHVHLAPGDIETGSIIVANVIIERRPGVWFNLGDFTAECEAFKAEHKIKTTGVRSDLDTETGVMDWVDSFTAKLVESGKV